MSTGCSAYIATVHFQREINVALILSHTHTKKVTTPYAIQKLHTHTHKTSNIHFNVC